MELTLLLKNENGCISVTHTSFNEADLKEWADRYAKDMGWNDEVLSVIIEEFKP
jgi:hypothetical protein